MFDRLFTWFQHKYNLLFAGLLASICLVFIFVRPFNSPWHRFINGDGLGYYAYLPAQFIYNDTELNYTWFNGVYKEHYSAGTFENPEDNFLVTYKGKKINKYYQGLSFAWFPFFITAHAITRLTHYPADGYSLPYQLAIALASLLYLFLGLLFLKRLLQKLFANPWVSVIVPVFLFYGTSLFNYAINYNSLTHIYSFTFLVLFCYTTYLFFNEASDKLRNLLLMLFFYTLTLCIRPLNAVSLLLIIAFIPKGFFSQKPTFEKPGIKHLLILLTVLLLIIYQVKLMLTQTGSLIGNTYGKEHFNFSNSRLFDSLFSYYLGLFVYAPLMLVALFGFRHLSLNMRTILTVVFVSLLFLYSSWCYWPIVKRALIDYYFIPAILLGALLNALGSNKGRALVISVLIFCTIYFQFKEMQIRRGILDEFLTYKEVYWRNFFRTQKAFMYLVPPSSIINNLVHINGIDKEGELHSGFDEKKQVSVSPDLVGRKNSVHSFGTIPYPSMFSAIERKKIRLSFSIKAEEGTGEVHVFIIFKDKADKTIKEEAFYLKQEDLPIDTWDYMEFGCEITDTLLINTKTVDKVDFLLWNVEGNKTLYLKDAAIEFILCNEKFETPLTE